MDEHIKFRLDLLKEELAAYNEALKKLMKILDKLIKQQGGKNRIYT